MKPWLTWAFVGALCAAAYAAQGWRGVLLVVTVTVFWVLFQFSRLTRSMRRLAERPLGVVPNAVMFHAQLSKGMRLMEVLKLSDSLGRAVDPPPEAPGTLSAEPESFFWTDPAGDTVRIDLRNDKVDTWTLQRVVAADVAAETTT